MHVQGFQPSELALCKSSAERVGCLNLTRFVKSKRPGHLPHSFRFLERLSTRGKRS
jgi:hypothetical protein